MKVQSFPEKFSAKLICLIYYMNMSQYYIASITKLLSYLYYQISLM